MEPAPSPSDRWMLSPFSLPSATADRPECENRRPLPGDHRSASVGSWGNLLRRNRVRCPHPGKDATTKGQGDPLDTGVPQHIPPLFGNKNPWDYLFPFSLIDYQLSWKWNRDFEGRLPARSEERRVGKEGC